eukprot:COSAG02_NODE_2739_length_8128_cov_8.386100_6_plen_20_part_01
MSKSDSPLLPAGVGPTARAR